MVSVYILKNKASGKIYIGQTANLEKRLLRHNKILPLKNISYTYKNKGIWECIYKEEHQTRKEAMKRERWLKSGVGREYIKKVIMPL